MDKCERIKMVKAMEFICRQINDEDLFNDWLIIGIADGDVEYGDLDAQDKDGILDYYTEDDHFADLMDSFLRVMTKARKLCGLCCDGIVDR